MKVKVNMQQCIKCLGYHAHWWFTSSTPPPSCIERQKRMKK